MACQSKNALGSQLENNAVFAISVDGSNDSNSQLYPIVVVYFDNDEEKIKSSLLALDDCLGIVLGKILAI